MRRRLAAALAGVVAGVAMTAASLAPVSAAVSQPHVVSAWPVAWTPNLSGGTVRGTAIVGNEVVSGGSFTAACQAGPKADGYCKPGTKVSRDYIVAYTMKTGVISKSFRPALDGQIYQLAAGPKGTVYVAGAFVHADGKYHRGIVQLAVSNGAVVSSFKATLNNGYARTIAVHGKELYVGGEFTRVSGVTRTDIARLNTATGAVDAKFNFSISESLPSPLDPVKLMYLAVSPDGTRVVFDGPFGEVNGIARPRLAMIDTSATFGSTATLANWAAPILKVNCPVDVYTRGLDFSPTGTDFVIGDTGGPTWPNNQPNLCDAVAEFRTNDPAGTNAQPVWINWTGGDSIYVVADTGSVVYEGGHNRWLNNQRGHDSEAGGCFNDPSCKPVTVNGVGAVNAATGLAISTWTPGKTRGHGAELLQAFSGGLFIGSDGNYIHGEYRGEIGMFPLK
jgi:hypothetical protein